MPHHERSLFVTAFASPGLAGKLPTPMLCIHGIEAHGLRFFGLARQLPDVAIVAPDLRGHGQSPKTGPWTIEQHIADLAPLLDDLGPHAVVLGHSYGGYIAWELARAMPDRLSALVLVDPAVAISSEMADEVRASAASNLRWPDESTALRELLAQRAPEAHWSVALDIAVATQHDDSGSLRPLVVMEAIEACLEQVTGPLRPTTYRGPTLLVEAGRENGRYVSAELAADMRAQIGERMQHIVLDAIHTIPADRPDLLAASLRPFLAALSQDAG